MNRNPTSMATLSMERHSPAGLSSSDPIIRIKSQLKSYQTLLPVPTLRPRNDGQDSSIDYLRRRGMAESPEEPEKIWEQIEKHLQILAKIRK